MIWLLLACGENQTPYAPYESAASSLCIPNLDGELLAAEFPLQQSDGALYRVAESVSVDFALGRTTEGTPVWDFSGTIDGEQMAGFQVWQARSQDRWSLEDFPEATWLIANDSDADTVGVYDFTETGLWLLGTTSDDRAEDHWRYTEPVPLLQLPISEGDSYTVAGDIEAGQINGLPFVGRHHYDVSVVSRGELWLQNLRFTDVYRVNTILSVEPTTGTSFVIHQSSFFSECVGELVRIQSPPNATDFTFDSIASIRIVHFE